MEKGDLVSGQTEIYINGLIQGLTLISKVPCNAFMAATAMSLQENLIKALPSRQEQYQHQEEKVEIQSMYKVEIQSMYRQSRSRSADIVFM